MRARHIPLFGSVGVLLAATVVAAFPTQALGDTGCPTAVAPSLVNSTYEVDTAAKLQWVKDSGSMSASYKLTGSINMSGCTWTRGIGTYGAPFTGTFDGNSKTISNLTVVGATSTSGLGLVGYLSGSISNITLASPTITGGTSNDYGGLVGKVNASGSVSDATLTSVSVSGGQQTGGAIGSTASGSTVTNVSVSGSVSATSGVGGGVTGSLSGTMSNVTSSVNVTGSYTLGGIAGSMGSSASLTNATASGDVTGTSSTVGGAVGSAGGTSPTCSTITSVTTSGNVSGTMYAGGILAYGDCYFVYQSSSSATITASSSHAGGIVAYDNFPGRVEKSYFTGSVTATESVGGIAGLSRSVIVDSWSSGSVTATSATNGGRAGGLVGWFRNTGGAYPNAQITRSYARGAVTPPAGGSSTVGGLIGDYYSGTITGGLWDIQTTGRSTSQGTGAKGYTSQQLKDHVLYNADNLNWGMTDGISSGDGVSTGTVWSVCSGANSGYPFLTRQGLSGTCLPTMAYYGNGNDGGTAPVDASTPYNSGDTVTVVGNTGTLTKTSRFFSGWNTKADGTGTTYNSGDTFAITAPVMLFAVWTTSLQITYNANGGTGTIANTTGASGASVTLSTGSGFTREGYILSRWNTLAGGGGVSYSKNETVTMPAGGLTLYAVWTALPAVTYNANGGSGTVATQYALGGDPLVLSNGSGFTRTGHILSRWDTLAGGGGVPYSKNESILMPPGGLTLFAIWTSTATATTTTTTTVAQATTTTVASATTVVAGAGTTTTVPGATTVQSPVSSTPAASVPAAVGSGNSASGSASGATTTTLSSGKSTGSSSGSTTTVMVTATTTSPTTTTLAPATGPDVPGVGTGEVGATIGGSPATARVEARDNSLVVTVGDATVSYAVKDRTGVPRGVSAASALTLRPGDTLTVGFTGFGSGFVARARLLPGGIPLGQMRLADGSGSIVSVIPDSTRDGEHRIVTEAASKDGKPVVVAYGITVGSDAPQGTPWSKVFLIIVGLAAATGLLVPAARRRRNDD